MNTELTIKNTVKTTWSVIKSNWKEVLLVYTSLSFIYTVVYIISVFVAGSIAFYIAPNAILTIILFIAMIIAITSLANLIIFPFNLSYSLNKIENKQNAIKNAISKITIKNLWHLFVFSLTGILAFSIVGLIGAIVFAVIPAALKFVLAAVFIVLFIYITVRIVFTPYIIVNENKSFIPALKESWQKTDGKVFAVFKSLYIPLFIVGLILGFIMSILDNIFGAPDAQDPFTLAQSLSTAYEIILSFAIHIIYSIATFFLMGVVYKFLFAENSHISSQEQKEQVN